MKQIQSAPRWPGRKLALAAVAGFIALMAFFQPAPASADEAKYYLDYSTTEVREGESVDVFLVRVTNHQHGVNFGAYWHTDAERRANRVKRTFRTQVDALTESNETFTARFSSTRNVVDLDDPARDEKCEITIIDTPNITSIAIISEPVRDNNTYGIGETIEIEATLSTSVDVDGNPGLGLRVDSDWRYARYLRGSGSD